MTKKFKILLITFSLLVGSMFSANTNALEIEANFNGEMLESSSVDAISSSTIIKYSDHLKLEEKKFWKTEYRNRTPYGGYLYYVRTKEINGRKYALYSGKLYRNATRPFRKKFMEVR
ncbi:hypothetical protein [Parvimonas parva]|uniref:Uncharacterized protein n=1 Tax=Parvimonas parva TaxID=2769485 RepID=A0ABS1C776_9FIRM|nr:hypothetical protein [Parvimonas parva]MBK1467941.1 hypothetical protein [Parvimonas parva]